MWELKSFDQYIICANIKKIKCQMVNNARNQKTGCFDTFIVDKNQKRCQYHIVILIDIHQSMRSHKFLSTKADPWLSAFDCLGQNVS